jgi:hypothetical protein
MKRLQYWKTKLPAARAEERQIARQYNQIARALFRACDRVEMIEKRIKDEKDKLARAKQ